MQKIIPHLWFDKEAKEAAEFYIAAFPDSHIITSTTLHGTPGDDTFVVNFSLKGYEFMAISAGPHFTINPSISFILNFDPSEDTQAEAGLRELWEKLTDGGTALMPLQEYPFSKLYGWVKDKFGVSWQLMLTNPEGEPRPFITPSLMFSGDNTNRAEEAIKFYLSIFKDSRQGTLARYSETTGPAKKDSVMFADFMLESQWFAAMDSSEEQTFTFSEGLSLLINCDTQEEVDYYWDKLSNVPEAEQCGWLKDKFGVSWQVVPKALNDMLNRGTPEQKDRVTQAFLKMKKLHVAELEDAYNGRG